MSRQRLNVGVLITAQDADIAAFFNILLQAGQRPAKWLSAMLVAKIMEIPFSIPNLRNSEFCKPLKEPTPSILFGNGSAGEKPRYGWQVRGSHGEIIEGSVVNLSFCRPEIIQIILQMRKNEIRSSTYLKELIRHDMECGETEMTEKDVDRLLREYYLECGRKKAKSSSD